MSVCFLFVLVSQIQRHKKIVTDMAKLAIKSEGLILLGNVFSKYSIKLTLDLNIPPKRLYLMDFICTFVDEESFKKATRLKCFQSVKDRSLYGNFLDTYGFNYYFVKKMDIDEAKQ